MPKKKPKPARVEPPRLKALSYDQLMLLDEFQIEQLFPLGIVKAVGEKFTSAIEGEKPHKTLKALLRDKRKRQEKLTYMVGSSPQRLRWDAKQKRWVPKKFQGDEEHGYTENPSRALDSSAPSPPREDQERFTKEAGERFASLRSEDLSRAALRSYMARIRDLAIQRIKAGEDPSPVFEAALEELGREDDRKAA